MEHFSRLGWTIFAVSCATLAAGSEQGLGQPIAIFNDPPAAYLLHSPSQGYLGVNFHDIDNDRASVLKLKDAHGVEIITVDHDAPANKAGLKVHDVVLEMNGQRLEGADQFRRMLKETPPGHTVNFVISRDGQQQTITAQLGERSQVEAKAWSQHFTVPDPSDETTSQGLIAPSSHGFGSGFFGVFTTNGLYIGADVDAISTQLASYFGVSDGAGLLVKSVDENSPAAAAGLKAGDVITKVNNGAMASRADWLKTLHNNRGKQVQVTVMRNKKEETLNMQAGEPKKKGELEIPDFCPEQELFPQNLNAEVDSDFAFVEPGPLTLDTEALAQQAKILSRSIDAQKLSKEIQKEMGSVDFKKMQQEIQRQMDELRENLDPRVLEPMQ